jgi:hypothetical protein
MPYLLEETCHVMDAFEVNKEFCNDDFHFWIKGEYDPESNEFSFTVRINPQLDGTDMGDFFKDLKQQLEKRRTLEETSDLIANMLEHDNVRVQELGTIVNAAADKAWAEHFLESSL